MFLPEVAAWFGERFGAPTAPQREGWPAIAAGRDTLIAAPTGSGKTLAAFLWCLDDLIRRATAGGVAGGAPLTDAIHVVYVSPLKALSNDIHRNLVAPLAELAARLPAASAIRVAVRTGDTPQAERQAMAKRPPHILVTTPESLYLVLTSVRGQAALANVRTVIVDELHALADDRRGAHLALSLERLDALVVATGGARPQRIGLSATQRPIELCADFLTGGQARAIREGAGGGAPLACAIVDSGHVRQLDLEIVAPDGELGAVCTHEQWADIYDQIAALTKAHKTTIVFTGTRKLVERVAHALSERLGEDQVAAHHGAMSRQARLEAERRLKHDEARVVVATASLELGIDVGAVELVCQLGSPRAIATFLQRIGRAGHALRATPKGKLFALTRDDLIECGALVRAVRAGRLDALSVPDHPLDVLAQQLVAACAGTGWDEDALFALVRRAYPYRNLPRAEFDAVVEMLSEGFATRRGRSSAYLHRDQVNHVVRGRRAARLAAILSGGAIPERADYEVIADPEGVKVGTLDEDFAVESNAGDVFLLGNMSWRIRRVEQGRVRVEDARGMSPSIPFWLGEGPTRTAELSEEVSAVRAGVAERLPDLARQAGPAAERAPREDLALDAGVAWLGVECGMAPRYARQVVDYLAATRAALGVVPTQQCLVAERFFDEGGGMQLVVHAPFGARVNRAWGMALRKSFCRTFDFELQAAATDDGIVLSLGAQHSFPLEAVFEFVRGDRAREVLVQAALQAPMFGTRWRWNTTRALAVPRRTSKGKVPPLLQRMRAEDLLAAVFPAQAGCQDNHGGGDIEPPDHPLVNQTLRDCLTEVMDADGLQVLLAQLEAGALQLVARDVPEPSPISAQILNANPYAYLDDAPLEERRTRAVSMRRGLPADVAAEIGALDPDAIATVRRDAAPAPRDADELHDTLCLVGALPEAATTPAWRTWLDALSAAKRATRMIVDGGFVTWVAAERLPLAQAAYGAALLDPLIAAAPGAKPAEHEEAVTAIVRGRLESCGPTTVAETAAALGVGESDAEIACARLESEGIVLRGRFTRGATAEWCDRRLLARIHRLTLGRLRREIEPVPPAELGRFLLHWQHVAPGTQLHGAAGLAAVLAQLQGIEAPVGQWEREILPARVAGYAPALLDELCLSGEIVWGRRSDSTASMTTRATPITFWQRAATPWMLAGRHVVDSAAPPADPEAPAEIVARTLTARGALFYAELLEVTGLVRAQLDEALWALVATGRATADGFGALRSLAGDAARRTGRWSLLDQGPGAGAVPAPELLAERHARQLLDRYGVVFREITPRELLPPWREILVVLRRLEARGEIRGGRFVAGYVGEQFALPQAVDSLRALRRNPAILPALTLAPRDPLRGLGIASAALAEPAVAATAV